MDRARLFRDHAEEWRRVVETNHLSPHNIPVALELAIAWETMAQNEERVERSKIAIEESKHLLES